MMMLVSCCAAPFVDLGSFLSCCVAPSCCVTPFCNMGVMQIRHRLNVGVLFQIFLTVCFSPFCPENLRFSYILFGQLYFLFVRLDASFLNEYTHLTSCTSFFLA